MNLPIPHPPPAIQLDSIHVSYGTLQALTNVSLTITAEIVTALIGMNGSGKSTLLKTILGLIEPNSGSVRIHGLTPTQARKKNFIGYVSQNEDVDWDFPLIVKDVVMMGRYAHMGPTRRPKQADHAAVTAALQHVALEDLSSRHISQLSGGQKKRAFLARALAQDPDIFLLDEPFGGVDRTSQVTITNVLHTLCSQGKSVLISTHDIHSLDTLSQEAILLRNEILFHGTSAAALASKHLARTFGLDALPTQKPESA